ncbi:MAG: protein kinase [Candidatus Obscuribacterales bacterium]|nr:protein kinase [Candidatus Obscuribacterales bacterium]
MSLFAPGTVVDETYTIIRIVGQGGMGTVYTAQETGLERIVALKVLHPTLVGDQDNQQRFFREGQVLASLSHPHITKLYRFGMWRKKWPYIAMEYIDGVELRTLLEDGQRLPVSRGLKLASQICLAMQSAHNAGVTHRDLTPNNIILLKREHDRDPDYPKVIDFGLSLFHPPDRTTEQKLTRTGTLVGTVFYMSPEQCSGLRVDHRADIYSLGCILYQMLTGRPPFQADNPIALMRQHTTEQPRPLSEHLPLEEIPEGLENVIRHALAKDPADRYKSMLELHKDLEMVQSGHGQGVSAPPPAAPRKKFKMPLIVPVCLVAILVISSGAIVLLNTRQRGSIEETTSSPPLRRLKNIDNYSSPEKKAQYLRSWLEHYGSNVSMDSSTARFNLAKLLEESHSDTIEANRYLDEAAEEAKQVFKTSWHGGKGDEAAAAINLLSKIRTEGEARKTLKKDLQQLLPLLQSPDGTQMFRTMNHIRSELAYCYMEESDYKAAEPLLEANLKTAERCSMTETERFEAMVALCICSQKRGKKAVLARRLNSAYLASERIEPSLGVKSKVTLAIMFEECALPRLCIDESKIAERCDLKEISQEMLGQFNVAKAKAFVQLHLPEEAISILNTTVDSSPPAVTISLLDALIQLNASAEMHKTEEIGFVLDRILSDERYRDYTDQIMALVYQTEHRSFYNESKSIAEKLLRRISRPRNWEHSAPERAAYHLSCMAVRFQRLGLFKDAESLFNRAGSILAANPQEKYSQGQLAHDSGKAWLLNSQDRRDEAIQLCDQVMASPPGAAILPDASRMEFLLIKGRILLKQKRLDEAERILTQYCELSKRNDKAGALVIGLIDLSNVPFERGDFKASERYLLQAREKFASASPDVRQLGYLALSNVYIRLKDDERAAQCLDDYAALNGPYSNSILNKIVIQRYEGIEKRGGKAGKHFATLRSKLTLPKG